MNHPRLAALAGILAVTAVAFQQARSAAQPVKESQSAKDAASDDFAVRYARAHLRVAELTLQKAQDMNRRVPQTLAKGIIEQFSDDVEFAKAQVEGATRSAKSDTFTLWLRRAELDQVARESRLKTATEANQRVKGAFSPIDLERLRAGIELAKLRVERGQSLSDAPPEAKLQWQIEMISEGLNRVDEMVSLSLQNRLAEFF